MTPGTLSAVILRSSRKRISNLRGTTLRSYCLTLTLKISTRAVTFLKDWLLPIIVSLGVKLKP